MDVTIGGKGVGNNKNIAWINSAKAIGMIMIFFVHCQAYWGYRVFNWSRYCAPVYVNVFFFISGYLLFGKHLSKPVVGLDLEQYWKVFGLQIQNIVFRLVIPSIIFSIVEFVPACLLKSREISFTAFIAKTVGGGTYWFISALVVAELLVCVMLLTRVKAIWVYFICSCFICIAGMILVSKDVTLFSFDSDFPWMYKHSMLSVLFLAMGGVYWKYENKIRIVTDNVLALFFMAVTYVALLTLYPGSFKTSISSLNLNAAGIGISVLGIAVVVSICQKLPEIELLQVIGKETLGYYILCGAVPIVMSKVLSNFLPEKAFLGWIVLFIGSFVLTGVIVYLLKKMLPFLFDLRVLKNHKEA